MCTARVLLLDGLKFQEFLKNSKIYFYINLSLLMFDIRSYLCYISQGHKVNMSGWVVKIPTADDISLSCKTKIGY